MKAFVISFDPYYTVIAGAHAAVMNSPLILDWWHYLNGTYLVKSTATDAYQLRQDLLTRWPGGWFVILEVSTPADGSLPKEAWDWINTRI